MKVRFSISQRKKSRGNMTWYGRKYVDGLLVSEESLATKRKADAQAWLDSMNAARFSPEFMMKMERKDYGIEESVRAFMDFQFSTKGSGSRTCWQYDMNMRLWVKWCLERGVRTLRSFGKVEAVEYASSVSSSCAPKTAREKIRMVSQFVKWASSTYDVDGWEPMKTVVPPKLVKRQKPFWTPEEIDMILDNAPTPEYRLFWALMAFTGLRHSEAVAFGPSSICEDRLRVVGKGNKEAFVPIGRRLRDEISSVKIYDGMFMKSAFETDSLCISVLKKAVSAAGLDNEGVTNHRFRHSFCSNLIRAGVGPKQVQKLARHENISITMDTYSHLLEDDLKGCVDLL